MRPSKRKFRLTRAGKILFATLAAFIIAAVFLTVRWLINRNKYYGNADFGISDYISRTDMDGDGVDDQTDILAGARAYTATRPIYESRYYSGGWPDDGFGVCTDVVANALKSAGYDLQELVAEDIARSPEAYDGDCGDRNIDFRRVRNLLVYFERHAISLTCDLGEIGEWQGGDVVVFEGHIGIISDRRNEKGVPYLIHHGGANGEGCPLRPNYEENVLGLQKKILGHFRIS